MNIIFSIWSTALSCSGRKHWILRKLFPGQGACPSSGCGYLSHLMNSKVKISADLSTGVTMPPECQDKSLLSLFLASSLDTIAHIWCIISVSVNTRRMKDLICYRSDFWCKCVFRDQTLSLCYLADMQKPICDPKHAKFYPVCIIVAHLKRKRLILKKILDN